MAQLCGNRVNQILYDTDVHPVWTPLHMTSPQMRTRMDTSFHSCVSTQWVPLDRVLQRDAMVGQ